MMVKAKFMMFIVNLRNGRRGRLHKFWALQAFKDPRLTPAVGPTLQAAVFHDENCAMILRKAR
jgi:hypothetical protein